MGLFHKVNDVAIVDAFRYTSFRKGQEHKHFAGYVADLDINPLVYVSVSVKVR